MNAPVHDVELSESANAPTPPKRNVMADIREALRRARRPLTIAEVIAAIPHPDRNVGARIGAMVKRGVINRVHIPFGPDVYVLTQRGVYAV